MKHVLFFPFLRKGSFNSHQCSFSSELKISLSGPAAGVLSSVCANMVVSTMPRGQLAGQMLPAQGCGDVEGPMLSPLWCPQPQLSSHVAAQGWVWPGHPARL